MIQMGKKNWISRRHKIIQDIAVLILGPISRCRYGITVELFEDQIVQVDGRNKVRQFLILFNHQTLFDQFFVGMAFKKKPIYFMASEDIFSTGWIARLLTWAVAPIPIRKQVADIRAVKACLRIAKEGGTIALAPEGNRTYSGRTCNINPAITGLVRKLKMPVAIFRIEGGYGIHPRWSNVVRKGKMYGSVTRVIEPEEAAGWTDDELFEVLKDELTVDDNKVDGEYHHRQSAEYMERAIYVCPECGFAKFESHDDTLSCQKCGMQVKYTATKELNPQKPFRFFGDWYDYQNEFVNRYNPDEHRDNPVFTDNADLSEVIVYNRKRPVQKGVQLRLFGDRMEADAGGIDGSNGTGGTVFRFEDTDAVTVLGKNKLNIYHEGKIWQLKGDVRFNALKYVNLFNRYHNIRKGNPNGKFLGL
jgi:1-acyl-sn-glycerol-3-phosphate acyltransferase